MSSLHQKRRSSARSGRSATFAAIVGLILVLVLGACSSADDQDVNTSAVSTTAPLQTPGQSAAEPPTAASEVVIPAAAPVAPIAEPAGQLADEAPGVWQVAGSVDGLNVRAQPGATSTYVGIFAPGETNIQSTGRRAEVGGNEWKEVSFAQGAGFGWVASTYLVPAGAPAADAQPAAAIPVTTARRECFAGGAASAGHVIRFDFSEDGRSFVAAMRVATGSALEYFSAAGQKTPPNPFSVTVRSVASGAERTEQWTFGIDGVELPSGVAVDLVQCSDSAALVTELDGAVPG